MNAAVGHMGLDGNRCIRVIPRHLTPAQRGNLLHTYNVLYIFAGTLKLHVAFSREGPEKVYVQHLLKQNADDVWKLLDEGGHLYVCG